MSEWHQVVPRYYIGVISEIIDWVSANDISYTDWRWENDRNDTPVIPYVFSFKDPKVATVFALRFG